MNEKLKKTGKYNREKRVKYKKELKRFDTILKEIFSEAIGKIYLLSNW